MMLLKVLNRGQSAEGDEAGGRIQSGCREELEARQGSITTRGAS